MPLTPARDRVKQQNEMFRLYPSYRYKGNESCIVRSKKEDEKLLADGWEKTPIKAFFAHLPDELKDDEEKIKVHTKVVEGVAAMSNLMLKLKGMRNRKQILAVAYELCIDVPNPDGKLKDIKEYILAQAKTKEGPVIIDGDPNPNVH